MIGETAIAGIITGLIRTHKIDQWAKLILSMGGTAFVTFFGTFSTVGLSTLAAGRGLPEAFGWALFTAAGSMAAITFFGWTRSPLTKGIPISAPGSVVETQNKILRDQNVVTWEGKK